MNITQKIEATLKTVINVTGEYTTNQIVDTVMKLHPDLNRDSVKRALSKAIENVEFSWLTRPRQGVYKIDARFNSMPQSYLTPIRSPSVGRTLVGISRDHSGSMSSYSTAAMKDYNTLLADLRAGDKISKTTVSVVRCGHSYNENVVKEFGNIDIRNIADLTTYPTPGPNTALWDSVKMIIDILISCPTTPADAFLVMIITDGLDNSSKVWSRDSIMSEMKRLQATDRWTFVFRVPPNTRQQFVRMGIPNDNIQEWELTSAGMEHATTLNTVATASYYNARSAGVTFTNKFYTDVSAVNTKVLQRTLVDISKEVKAYVVGTHDTQAVRDFIESKINAEFTKGSAFYQLTKTELVQAYKEILIRDKKTGAVYYGAAARDLIGLPTSTEIKVAPGNHGNYDIYIQSTSVNRILPIGSMVMYWDQHGTAYKTGRSAS